MASEEVLNAVPEQQFVTDDLLLAVQDGLARDEPKALRRPGARRWLCRRNGHSQWIG
jgi:hypothetical protein